MVLHRIRAELLRRPMLAVGLLVLIGLALRLYNLTHGRGFHPDERHIVDVTSKLLEQGMNPKSFAYGSLPFYIVWIVGQIVGVFSDWYRHYDGLFTVGRSVAAFTYAFSGFFLFRLSKFITPDPKVGILAVAFLTFNVFSLQLTRFVTVDPFLTVIALGAFWALASAIEKPSWRRYGILGIALGLALGTKTSGLTLIGPIVLALLWKHFPWKGRSDISWKNTIRIIAGGGWIFAVAALTLRIISPFFFLDYETFTRHQDEQISMVRGLWRPPYTIQYADTTPFIYPLEQMFWFTMGPPLALACLGGIGWAVWRAKKEPSPLIVGLICWVLGFYLSTAGQYVKFPRYLLPVYPVLFLFAAWALLGIERNLRKFKPLTSFVLIWTVLYGLGFETIYMKDHSYVNGSKWVYENIPPRSRILSVHWDDKIPIGLPGKSSEQYRMWKEEDELPFYDQDNHQKLDKILTRLSEADYLIFPTMRIPGSLTRVPDEFKHSNAALSLLFEGKLGYKLVHVQKEYPNIGPFIWSDDTADESFSVYDHPKVMVFQNEARIPKDDLMRLTLQRVEEGRFLTPSEILSVGLKW